MDVRRPRVVEHAVPPLDADGDVPVRPEVAPFDRKGRVGLDLYEEAAAGA